MTAQTGTNKTALVAATGAGGAGAILNPEGIDLIIKRAMINVKTVATAACTINVGIAVNGTTASDNLLDGLDVNAAAGVFDNQSSPGTNGKAVLLWRAGEYITVSETTGAIAGLVGDIHLDYVRA